MDLLALPVLLSGVGNSLNVFRNSLFFRRISLFRYLGNLAGKLRNHWAHRPSENGNCLGIAKFPVLFPVSNVKLGRNGAVPRHFASTGPALMADHQFISFLVACSLSFRNLVLALDDLRREAGEALTDIARTFGVHHTTIGRLRA